MGYVSLPEGKNCCFKENGVKKSPHAACPLVAFLRHFPTSRVATSSRGQVMLNNHPRKGYISKTCPLQTQKRTRVVFGEVFCSPQNDLDMFRYLGGWVVEI